MKTTISDCLSGKENNFDFIRFLAALLVIFSHSFYLTPYAKEPLLAATSGRYDLGMICVAAFFIISGLLITRSFERAKSLTEYFAARALRIFPALIFVIWGTVYIIGPLFTTYSLEDYFLDPRTAKYLFYNTILMKNEFHLPGLFEGNFYPKIVNGSIWTLPDELLCYVLVAVIGLLCSKNYKQSFILAAFMLVFFYNEFLHQQEAVAKNGYYFLCGALIYLNRRNIVLNKSVAVIALCLFLGNLFYNPHLFSSIIVTGVTLGYVVMYLSFIKTTHIKNFARHGDYSYGLYIYAWPIQQILYFWFFNQHPFVFFLLSACTSFAMAVLSWNLIEKNTLRWKVYFQPGNTKMFLEVWKAYKEKMNRLVNNLSST